MADLLSELEALARAAGDAIRSAAYEKHLEELRVRFPGKKGELSQVLRGMGQLAADLRPKVGEVANRVRDEVEGLLDQGKARLQDLALQAELSGRPIDVTAPGRALL